MMARVNRLQAGLRDVGVYLRGRQAAVSQQHLHGTQVGSVIEQVRGECVTQRMRRKGTKGPGPEIKTS